MDNLAENINKIEPVTSSAHPCLEYINHSDILNDLSCSMIVDSQSPRKLNMTTRPRKIQTQKKSNAPGNSNAPVTLDDNHMLNVVEIATEMKETQVAPANRELNLVSHVDSVNQVNLESPMDSSKSLLSKSHLTLGSIQARKRSAWVDDKTIKNCNDCKKKFNFYLRLHHCRLCGKGFCYYCSRFQMQIPDSIDNLPAEHSGLISFASLSNLGNLNINHKPKVRVCSGCAKQINTVRQLENSIKVFDLLPLTVKDYHKMTLVCREWNQLGNYYLSKFREIQYKLPGQAYSPLEQQMLWNHRDLLVGHNLWLSNLIRSEPKQPFNLSLSNIGISSHLSRLSYPSNPSNPSKPSNASNSSNSKSNFSCPSNSTSNTSNPRRSHQATCRELMCSRLCQPEMTSFELITLLETSRRSDSLKKIILTRLSTIPVLEMSCYLPILVQEMCYEPVTKSQLLPFLMKQACRSLNLAIEIFWEWKVKLGYNQLTTEQRQLFQFASEKLLKIVDNDIRIALEDSERLIIFLNSLPRKATLEQIQMIFIKNQSLFENLRIPTYPQLISKAVLIDQIKIKDSASRPLFIPLKCYHKCLKKECEYYLLYKFEDIRQDQQVIKTIRLMNLILSQELKLETQSDQPDLKIITYQVLPTSSRSGLIEIIPNCATLFEIEKEFTIFNYILENNRQANLSADQLRQRFLKSCAAYCVITYLLGVGDRHLDNIMVTKSGFLFHIDYGFIVGSDPKPMTHPTMRITSGMVDALGGAQSQYYKDFILLSQKIHHCLRRRMGIFVTLLRLLVQVTPPIQRSVLSLESLENELLKRFMYGENYEEAQMQLEVQISSSSQSYNEAVIDFFHYHQREKTLKCLVNGTVGWIGSFFSSDES